MTVRPDPDAFALDSFLLQQEHKSLLRFVVCGSVDHGKSTLVGLLVDEGKLLCEDQLEAVTATSRRAGTQDGDIDFSLLLDGLAAEREQKITIDVAYRFFTTDKRKFIVADAPGHEQYTRNMATGASTADLAVILVNAAAGLTSQTKRHALIVATLGVRHVVVAVNKMDLTGWSEASFRRIVAEFNAFAADLGFAGITFVPVAARGGDNIVTRSPRMDWYHGPTLLEHLEQVQVEGAADAEQPFRMAIQYVNRPDADFRGYCGLVAGGEVFAGMAVQIWPSGRTVRVDRIITPQGESDLAVAGESVTLTFEQEVDLSRGDVLAEVGAPPLVGDRVAARIVWMTEAPLQRGRSYLLKAGTSTAQASLEGDLQVIDLDTRERRASERIADNEIGTCALRLDRPAAFDRYGANRITGSFILLDPDTYDTIGIGIVEGVVATAHGPAPKGTVNAAPRPGAGLLRRRAPDGPTESRVRSAVKALTWRAIASAMAFAIAYVLTRSFRFAGSVALADVVGRTILYYAHERMWSRIAWGSR